MLAKPLSVCQDGWVNMMPPIGFCGNPFWSQGTGFKVGTILTFLNLKIPLFGCGAFGSCVVSSQVRHKIRLSTCRGQTQVDRSVEHRKFQLVSRGMTLSGAPSGKKRKKHSIFFRSHLFLGKKNLHYSSWSTKKIQPAGCKGKKFGCFMFFFLLLLLLL